MPTTFGDYFRELRSRKGVPLRQFCLEGGFDAGNISKLERGLLQPPASETKLRDYATALGVAEGSEEWVTLTDLAAAARRTLPPDLAADKRLVERLPLLFRTLRGQRVDDKTLDELAEKIARS